MNSSPPWFRARMATPDTSSARSIAQARVDVPCHANRSAGELSCTRILPRFVASAHVRPKNHLPHHVWRVGGMSPARCRHRDPLARRLFTLAVPLPVVLKEAFHHARSFCADRYPAGYLVGEFSFSRPVPAHAQRI